jgi:hypothetical protein
MRARLPKELVFNADARYRNSRHVVSPCMRIVRYA